MANNSFCRSKTYDLWDNFPTSVLTQIISQARHLRRAILSVSNKTVWYKLCFFFLFPLLKCVSIQFCCNPCNGYGIMRADGFIFLAYDCHIQVHYSDLNTSIYAKAILLQGSPAWLLYIKTHLYSPAQPGSWLCERVTHKSELNLLASWIILSAKYWEVICHRQSLFP